MVNNTLISVIIPAYNTEKYIEKCIDSVLSQSHESLEVIVVDDGSNDNTVNIVKDMMIKDNRLSLVCQQHQNASIARNKGMEIAKGEYYVFIDADDILLPDALKLFLDTAISNNADFVIGNMQEISEAGEIISNLTMFENDTEGKEYWKYFKYMPAPTNKFYKASVIKANNIVFGNVRIGQDLNFYYKYLCCCQKICTVADYMYQWRDVSTGMSNKKDLKLFDITESFVDIRRFYAEKGLDNDYKNYVVPNEFRHYYRQMEKQKLYKSFALRKMIVNYFLYMIKNLDLSYCEDLSEYKKDISNFKIKKFFKLLYISPLYRLISK